MSWLGQLSAPLELSGGTGVWQALENSCVVERGWVALGLGTVDMDRKLMLYN